MVAGAFNRMVVMIGDLNEASDNQNNPLKERQSGHGREIRALSIHVLKEMIVFQFQEWFVRQEKVQKTTR